MSASKKRKDGLTQTRLCDKSKREKQGVSYERGMLRYAMLCYVRNMDGKGQQKLLKFPALEKTCSGSTHSSLGQRELP